MLLGTALCITECLVPSLASAHYMPVTASKLRQSKISPDIVICPLRSRTASGLQLIYTLLMRNNRLISNSGKNRTFSTLHKISKASGNLDILFWKSSVNIGQITPSWNPEVGGNALIVQVKQFHKNKLQIGLNVCVTLLSSIQLP